MVYALHLSSVQFRGQSSVSMPPEPATISESGKLSGDRRHCAVMIRFVQPFKYG